MSSFDFIVYGDDIVSSKPAPDIFLRSMEHFGIDPQDTVIFEDSGSGLLASHAAGAFTVYVPDIAPVFEEAQAAVDVTLRDLSEGISLIRTLRKQ
jgi:beta-phosphoglucomutase-like phosphatase (HAD superfamily)